jgi:hypothetical protein
MPPTRPQVQQTPETYPRRYVEDVYKPRTQLEVFFNVLKERSDAGVWMRKLDAYGRSR